tara:strand:+ start:309 stop:500 length:192 start_codon:yes stop_codon:yes gene_type:complete
MQTFKEHIQEAVDKKMISKMRAWTYNAINNTNMASDEIRKKFADKFGGENMKYYREFEADMVD